MLTNNFTSICGIYMEALCGHVVLFFFLSQEIFYCKKTNSFLKRCELYLLLKGDSARPYQQTFKICLGRPSYPAFQAWLQEGAPMTCVQARKTQEHLKQLPYRVFSALLCLVHSLWTVCHGWPYQANKGPYNWVSLGQAKLSTMIMW